MRGARRALVGAALLLVASARSAFAHRLDELLQAATLEVSGERVTLHLRLAPGVKVFPMMLAAIDADGDGRMSDAEQRAYAAVVLRDLSLELDGVRLRPRLTAARFPELEALREGEGEITLDFEAQAPNGIGARRLVFHNRHLRAISSYLANGLVPRDPDIRVQGQERNETQSLYRMQYLQGETDEAWWPGWWDGPGRWLALTLLSVAGFVMLVRHEQRV